MNTLKKSKHGTLLTIYNDVFQGKSIQEYGEYCELEISLIKKILLKNSTVYDIGAGFGLYSFPISRHLSNKGKVFAFEPERHSFYILTANTIINNIKNIYVNNFGLGKKEATMPIQEINIHTVDDFGATNLQNQPTTGRSYIAYTKKLDNLKLVKPDFIKLSANGMELEILEGGSNIIKEHKPTLLINAQYDMQNCEMIEFLKENNYKIYKYISPIYNPKNWFKNNTNHFTDCYKCSFVCFSENKEPKNLSSFDIEKLQ